jgi:tRNA (mo5U34)-methyltransferase
MRDGDWRDEDIADAVASIPLWYHTIDLPRSVTTPGWFDHRPIIDDLPWPDVRGKRCLDIGTFDGYLAFEMERRGASEVVATDIGSHEEWDWPPALLTKGLSFAEGLFGPKGRGFEIASRFLGSSVRKVVANVYDLSPDAIGAFDVVVCGTLLLHLRDPFRALEAIRSVCRGHFLSAEQIELSPTLAYRRTAMTTIEYIDDVRWHIPNLAGHRKMIEAAGFRVVRAPKPYSLPFGVGHPPSAAGPLRRLVGRLATGRYGVPHSAVLAEPS